MKKIIFLFICLMTLLALPIFALEGEVSISVSSPTIVVPSVTPSRNWSDDISDSLWQEVSFYVDQDTGPVNPFYRAVYAYFQHSQQSYWPSSPDKQTILTTIKNSVGLNGLLNFDTVNTKNVYDSQVPVRLNITSIQRTTVNGVTFPTDHYYVGKQTDNVWKYMIDRGAGGFTADDKIWEYWSDVGGTNSYGLFRASVKLRIGFPTGKYAGTYLGNLIFITQSQ